MPCLTPLLDCLCLCLAGETPAPRHQAMSVQCLCQLRPPHRRMSLTLLWLAQEAAVSCLCSSIAPRKEQ